MPPAMPTQATTQVRRVSHITLIVDDQDAAAEFYGNAFGAEIRTDQEFDFQGQTMRWLTMGLPGDGLEWAVQVPMPGPDGTTAVAGDGPMLVLEVADVDAVCEAAQAAGGTLASPPEELPWGRSAIVRDPSGNPFNLVSPTE